MKKIRNILSLALVFIMLIGLMPMNVFAEGEHNITTEATNGTVTANPTSAAKGASVKLTVKPANGYELDTLTVSGKSGDVQTADAEGTDAEVTKTFIMPDEDVTVTATFKKKLETVKTEAKTEVGNLANLSDDEKTAANKAIDDATDKAGVDKAVADARTKDANNKKALDEAKDKAKKEIEADNNLTKEEKKAANEAIDKAKTPDEVTKAVENAKKTEEKPDTKPTKYNITVKSIGNGYADADATESVAGKTITVTAKPYSGYAVARVYLKYNGITKNINTYYNGYYYDGRYYGRYNDYNKYLDVYENSSYYLRKYDSYREFLRHEYPSHYRYYEDYDYWTDRYDYDWYDRYDNYYYKYFDDFRRSRYDTYEEYLRAEHYTHYRDYYNYRYDYNWYNRYGYTTTDTFEMPASNVTVYVEFTDAYPYYYDDYYYYRTRRDRKAEEAKAKAEAAKKEEEEAKAKAEAEKLPQVYENKAVIAIGSNVLDKVSKNVHTVHQMDTPAYVKNGRVMLPLRYVAEALGLQVSWVPETKTVIIWDLTQRVEIPVKSNRIIVNGITYTSDVKPEIKSSRTMLPIANIARALGLIDGSDIIWDQYNKQVTLTRKVLSK